MMVYESGTNPLPRCVRDRFAKVNARYFSAQSAGDGANSQVAWAFHIFRCREIQLRGALIRYTFHACFGVDNPFINSTTRQIEKCDS